MARKAASYAEKKAIKCPLLFQKRNNKKYRSEIIIISSIVYDSLKNKQLKLLSV